MIHQKVARGAFCFWTAIGRPWGGIRPRRLAFAAAQRAFTERPEGKDFRLFVDRWGNRFLLNPYFHIDTEMLITGTYEWPLQRFLTRSIASGDVVVDVGANIGAMSFTMAKACGPSGLVLAVEPFADVRKRLQKHVELNSPHRVRIIPTALSNFTGTASLHIAEPDTRNSGQSSLEPVPSAKGAITVEVATLDDLVSEQGLRKIALVKCDIQGGEPRLLQGASNTLQNHRPLITTEVSPTDLKAAGFSPSEFLNAVKSFDYRLFLIDPKGRLSYEIFPEQVPDDQWYSVVVGVPSETARGSVFR
mgnify:CR=1 FL=1